MTWVIYMIFWSHTITLHEKYQNVLPILWKSTQPKIVKLQKHTNVVWNYQVFRNDTYFAQWQDLNLSNYSLLNQIQTLINTYKTT